MQLLSACAFGAYEARVINLDNELARSIHDRTSISPDAMSYYLRSGGHPPPCERGAVRRGRWSRGAVHQAAAEEAAGLRPAWPPTTLMASARTMTPNFPFLDIHGIAIMFSATTTVPTVRFLG